MLRERKKVRVELKTPARVRWGLFFYIKTAVLKDTKTVEEAASDFNDIHNLEGDTKVLIRDYYRMLELDRNCLEYGI